MSTSKTAPTPLNIALIVGSTREGRVADNLSRWAAALLHEERACAWM